MIKGTPLQAIKFASRLNNGMGEKFLQQYVDGKEISHWLVTLGEYKDTANKMPPAVTFETFCDLNPDPLAEALLPFIRRLEQPGTEEAADNDTVTFFVKDIKALRTAIGVLYYVK